MFVCVYCAFLLDLGLVAGSYQIPLGCWFHLSFLAAVVTIRCAKQEQLKKNRRILEHVMFLSYKYEFSKDKNMELSV